MIRIIACLFLISFNSFSQDTISITHWKSVPIPTNKKTLVNYNRGEVWWKVLLKDHNVFIVNNYQHDQAQLPFTIIKTQTETVFNITGTRAVLKVDDGYLVGIDCGEWGGDLFWYSIDGKTQRQLTGYRIKQFITRDKKIYAIDAYGTMIKIDKIKNEWITEQYLKFPFGQNPISVALDNQNNFIVITSDCLLKIDKDRKVTKIIENGFWAPYLYPTSIVINNNIVYAGMPMGIFKYNLDTEKKEWLMPK